MLALGGDAVDARVEQVAEAGGVDDARPVGRGGDDGGAQAGPLDRAEVVQRPRVDLDAACDGPVEHERTREVVRILMNAPAPSRAMRPAGTLMLNAGVDLLPSWAQTMLGLNRYAALRKTFARPGVRLVAPVIRWALVNGVSKRARRRAAAMRKREHEPD